MLALRYRADFVGAVNGSAACVVYGLPANPGGFELDVTIAPPTSGLPPPPFEVLLDAGSTSATYMGQFAPGAITPGVPNTFPVVFAEVDNPHLLLCVDDQKHPTFHGASGEHHGMETMQVRFADPGGLTEDLYILSMRLRLHAAAAV